MTRFTLKNPIIIGFFLCLLLPIIGFSSEGFSSATQPIEPNLTQQNTPPAKYDLSDFSQFKTDPIYGAKDARFVFIEYADYQCPYCKKFHQTLEKWFNTDHQKQLNSPFEVNWVFRHFPILGEKSMLKAKTAICVLNELGNDAFWVFNDLLFTQPIKPSKRLNYQQSLWLLASKQGWDVKTLMSCDNSKNYQTKLKLLAQQAKALNLGSTPSWFFLDLNTGKVIVGNGILNLTQLDQLLLDQTATP
ncbi:MAG: thioredoxin domain-containing protein [Saccharospirillaceae bacterium]|nr:DsbA family protein [Pseudomonadales bacterium]NRB78847.1 thioredoxin domain-containing protein [Saccharospirillaceae bacterium]